MPEDAEEIQETYSLKRASQVLGKNSSYVVRKTLEGVFHRMARGRYRKREIDEHAAYLREIDRKYPLAQ